MVAPPPPTRNALPPAQRVRLMRSTRKLGEILGADPHVLEDDALSSISSSSISSASTSSSTCLTTHSASSSVTSLSSSDDEPALTIPPYPHTLKKKKSKSILPRIRPSQPLFLKLNVKSHTRVPSADASVSPTSPISPLASLYDVKTPTQASQIVSYESSSLRSKLRARRASVASASWDFGVTGAVGVFNNTSTVTRSASITSVSSSAATTVSDARLRRKRMAKLKRTLGENVPYELVFGSSPTPTTSKSALVPPPTPASAAQLPSRKVRPPTPPKIKLPSPVSPPPCLPEIEVIGTEKLDPFTDPSSEEPTSDILIIGPTGAFTRPTSILSTASVYSQPSAGLEQRFDLSLLPPLPTSTPSKRSTVASKAKTDSPKLRPKAKSLNVHSRLRPLSLTPPASPPPPMPNPPSPFARGRSFLSFSPSTPVPATPHALNLNTSVLAPIADDKDNVFTPRAGSQSLDLPSSYRRSHWDNVPQTPAYHTGSDGTDVLSLGIPAFGRRKEKEWSGEWNKQDMSEVLKGLRGLKA